MFIFSLISANDTQTDINEMIDKCLLSLGRGELPAMNELYELTKSSVYGFILSVLKNRHDAEDVLHDCYVRIYASASSYSSMGKPLAWILTIAKNLAYKKLGERKRLSELQPEETEYGNELFSELSMEDGVVISACLNELSDEERQIVVLHAVSGFKHREIASFLRLPLPTVLSKYNRALKKLQKILEGGK